MSVYSKGAYLPVHRPDGTVAGVPILRDESGRHYIPLYPNNGKGAPPGPKLTYAGPGEVRRVYVGDVSKPIPPIDPKAVLVNAIEGAVTGIVALDLDPEGRPAHHYEPGSVLPEWVPVQVGQSGTTVALVVGPDSPDADVLKFGATVVEMFAADPGNPHRAALDLAFKDPPQGFDARARALVGAGLSEAANEIGRAVFGTPAPETCRDACERLATWVGATFGKGEPIAEDLRKIDDARDVWFSPAAGDLFVHWPVWLAWLVWTHRVKPEMERPVRVIALGLARDVTLAPERMHVDAELIHVNLATLPTRTATTVTDRRMARRLPAPLDALDKEAFWALLALVASADERDVIITGGMQELRSRLGISANDNTAIREALEAGQRLVVTFSTNDVAGGLWTWRTYRDPETGRYVIAIRAGHALDANAWRQRRDLSLLTPLAEPQNMPALVGDRRTYARQRAAQQYMLALVSERTRKDARDKRVILDGERVFVPFDFDADRRAIAEHCDLYRRSHADLSARWLDSWLHERNTPPRLPGIGGPSGPVFVRESPALFEVADPKLADFWREQVQRIDNASQRGKALSAKKRNG